MYTVDKDGLKDGDMVVMSPDQLFEKFGSCWLAILRSWQQEELMPDNYRLQDWASRQSPEMKNMAKVLAEMLSA